MTTAKKIARSKRSLLELAHELGNVSKACQLLGYSSQQFYEIRRNFQAFGADGLLDKLPTYEQHGLRVRTILSDNGREFCGREDRHPYELFLQLEEIEHRTTKVRRPQSNGFVERLHRTLLDEHFRVMGRKKFYESVAEMQADLDVYLEYYNTKRPHQGYNMNGRTAAKVFVAGISKQKKPRSKEVVKKQKTA